jgi:hypothetical protein
VFAVPWLLAQFLVRVSVPVALSLLLSAVAILVPVVARL